MTTKCCPSCRRYFPIEQIRRKRLPHGGVRLICLACIARAKTRSDQGHLPHA